MYLAVLGRQSEISLAELTALYSRVKKINSNLATFDSNTTPNITRLGGSLKLAVKLSQTPLEYLSSLPDGKITIGISDYYAHSSAKSANSIALKFKKILVRHHRSVRVVANTSPTLSTATSLHNGLSGKNPRKIELIKTAKDWYKVIGVQDIESYANRDQARPARDAKVGMLPPKLAQILINLCGPLPLSSLILDPFCGTGVVLQEALLMGYRAYGTDINAKMINYSEKNLKWLIQHSIKYPTSSNNNPNLNTTPFQLDQGDATSFSWQQPINAVACECYLGQPMSQIPTEIKLKEQKQACSSIILGFLKNLSTQIAPNTPVTIAIPAWLRENGTYSRLNIIDEIANMGYNVNNKSRLGLFYHRESQIVARDIIILRKN
ncbi:DNA adenine methylase [Candidatus Saccharibacteria bacterium]|nr:DNA adenine methylase [Candidatus Saccharibacteria bacterium]